MELSEILNVVLGGSLFGTIVSIVTIRSALTKARAEAEKALAEADTVRLTNTEQATRILVDNIVNPLAEELNETRKEIAANRRETARLRKAIDAAGSCRYSATCPVLDRMRSTPKDSEGGKRGTSGCDNPHGQREPSVHRQRKRGGRGADADRECADVGSEPDDSDGQPP